MDVKGGRTDAQKSRSENGLYREKSGMLKSCARKNLRNSIWC